MLKSNQISIFLENDIIICILNYIQSYFWKETWIFLFYVFSFQPANGLWKFQLLSKGLIFIISVCLSVCPSICVSVLLSLFIYLVSFSLSLRGIKNKIIAWKSSNLDPNQKPEHSV